MLQQSVNNVLHLSSVQSLDFILSESTYCNGSDTHAESYTGTSKITGSVFMFLQTVVMLPEQNRPEVTETHHKYFFAH